MAGPDPPRDSIDESIRQLQAKAASRPAPASAAPRAVGLQWVILATLTIVVVVGGVVALWPSAAERVVGQVHQAGARLGSMIEGRLEPETLAPVPAANDADGDIRARRPPVRRPGATFGSRPEPLASGDGIPQAAALSAGTLSPLPNRAAAVDKAAIAGIARPVDEVYSSADRDVVPPSMRVPESPAQVLRELSRGIDAGGSAPSLELLINAEGVVEQARLQTDTPHMLDALVLSRAKTWQFEPARRAGTAVPYRLRLGWKQ